MNFVNTEIEEPDPPKDRTLWLLRVKRVEDKLSHRALAKASGISWSMIRKLERGEVPLTASMRRRIEGFLATGESQVPVHSGDDLLARRLIEIEARVVALERERGIF